MERIAAGRLDPEQLRREGVTEQVGEVPLARNCDEWRQLSKVDGGTLVIRANTAAVLARSIWAMTGDGLGTPLTREDMQHYADALSTAITAPDSTWRMRLAAAESVFQVMQSFMLAVTAARSRGIRPELGRMVTRFEELVGWFFEELNEKRTFESIYPMLDGMARAKGQQYWQSRTRASGLAVRFMVSMMRILLKLDRSSPQALAQAEAVVLDESRLAAVREALVEVSDLQRMFEEASGRARREVVPKEPA